jgi:hypothetical protein
LRRHAEELVACREQLVVASVATVFYLEVEAALRTQFLNGGRIQHEDARIAIAGEMLIGARDDGLCAVMGAALAPVLEVHERNGVVLSFPVEAEAVDGDDLLDARLVFQHVLLHGLHRLQRTGGRRARRRADRHDEVALVFVGQERGGQRDIEQRHDARDHTVKEHVTCGPRDHASERGTVARVALCEPPVEPAEKAALFVVFHVGALEQRGAQRRREREREHD